MKGLLKHYKRPRNTHYHYEFRGYLIDIWFIDYDWTWQLSAPGIRYSGKCESLGDGMRQAVDQINEIEVA